MSLKINFQSASGATQVVDVAGGLTLMEAAVRGGIEEIAAECGGGISCATCHVYIPESWRELTGVPSTMEDELLEIVPHRQPGSRLSCQIKLTDRMDGLVVGLPVV
jgi:2Fe-2S ferredoxin